MAEAATPPSNGKSSWRRRFSWSSAAKSARAVETGGSPSGPRMGRRMREVAKAAVAKTVLEEAQARGSRLASSAEALSPSSGAHRMSQGHEAAALAAAEREARVLPWSAAAPAPSAAPAAAAASASESSVAGAAASRSRPRSPGVKPLEASTEQLIAVLRGRGVVLPLTHQSHDWYVEMCAQHGVVGEITADALAAAERKNSAADAALMMEGDEGRSRIAKMRARYSFSGGQDEFLAQLHRANPTGAFSGQTGGHALASSSPREHRPSRDSPSLLGAVAEDTAVGAGAGAGVGRARRPSEDPMADYAEYDWLGDDAAVHAPAHALLEVTAQMKPSSSSVGVAALAYPPPTQGAALGSPPPPPPPPPPPTTTTTKTTMVGGEGPVGDEPGAGARGAASRSFEAWDAMEDYAEFDDDDDVQETGGGGGSSSGGAPQGGGAQGGGADDDEAARLRLIVAQLQAQLQEERTAREQLMAGTSPRSGGGGGGGGARARGGRAETEEDWLLNSDLRPSGGGLGSGGGIGGGGGAGAALPRPTPRWDALRGRHSHLLHEVVARAGQEAHLSAPTKERAGRRRRGSNERARSKDKNKKPSKKRPYLWMALRKRHPDLIGQVLMLGGAKLSFGHVLRVATEVQRGGQEAHLSEPTKARAGRRGSRDRRSRSPQKPQGPPPVPHKPPRQRSSAGAASAFVPMGDASAALSFLDEAVGETKAGYAADVLEEAVRKSRTSKMAPSPAKEAEGAGGRVRCASFTDELTGVTRPLPLERAASKPLVAANEDDGGDDGDGDLDVQLGGKLLEQPDGWNVTELTLPSADQLGRARAKQAPAAVHEEDEAPGALAADLQQPEGWNVTELTLPTADQLSRARAKQAPAAVHEEDEAPGALAADLQQPEGWHTTSMRLPNTGLVAAREKHAEAASIVEAQALMANLMAEMSQSGPPTVPAPRPPAEPAAAEAVAPATTSAVAEGVELEGGDEDDEDEDDEDGATRAKRVEWIKYYVSIGLDDKAYDLGWDGVPFSLDDDDDDDDEYDDEAEYVEEEGEEDEYDEYDEYESDDDDDDDDDDEPKEDRLKRIEWIKYYVANGMRDKAHDLGWDGVPFAVGGEA